MGKDDAILNQFKNVPVTFKVANGKSFMKTIDTIKQGVIEKLTNMRDTLLPKLMSGEIDVSKIN